MLHRRLGIRRWASTSNRRMQAFRSYPRRAPSRGGHVLNTEREPTCSRPQRHNNSRQLSSAHSPGLSWSRTGSTIRDLSSYTSHKRTANFPPPLQCASPGFLTIYLTVPVLNGLDGDV